MSRTHSITALMDGFNGMSPSDMADAILASEKHPFTRLNRDEVRWALYMLISKQHQRQRSNTIKTVYEEQEPWNPSSSSGRCRVSLSGDYWSARWLVGDELKPTRQLTRDDLMYLQEQYSRKGHELLARADMMESWRRLAHEEGVDVLGELEERGLELPNGAEVLV